MTGRGACRLAGDLEALLRAGMGLHLRHGGRQGSADEARRICAAVERSAGGRRVRRPPRPDRPSSPASPGLRAADADLRGRLRPRGPLGAASPYGSPPCTSASGRLATSSGEAQRVLRAAARCGLGLRSAGSLGLRLLGLRLPRPRPSPPRPLHLGVAAFAFGRRRCRRAPPAPPQSASPPARRPDARDGPSIIVMLRPSWLGRCSTMASSRELLGEAVEDRLAALGVRDLAPAEHDRDLDLVLVRAGSARRGPSWCRSRAAAIFGRNLISRTLICCWCLRAAFCFCACSYLYFE